jgi:uncharacterized membrane-anchored protein
MFHTQSTDKLINKVPEVTLLFWIVKIMTTTVGETSADFLNFNLGFGLSITSVVIGVLLLASLFFQLMQARYIPSIYWATVTLISVFGTLITDNLTDQLGVPLSLSSLVFGLLLLGTFTIWFLKERTLSIHTIHSGKRELFYWLAIFITFALGTAVGDFAAEQLQWGYAYSSIIFGGTIALITIAHHLFKLNSILCFWLAYILTRPLGASLGDFLTQPPNIGGLGISSMVINLVFITTIILIVAVFSVKQSTQEVKLL